MQEQRLLASVNAYISGDVDPGLFVFTGQLLPDTTPEQAEAAFRAEIGLAYKFNRRGFVRASNVQPVDVTPYLDRIRNLEENNTDLASKNSVLNDENEKLRNAPAKVIGNTVHMLPTSYRR